MFGSGEVAQRSGRYRVRIVSGEYRVKSHEKKVQEALDEGEASGWRLVSATTTNATGAFTTGIYWDTRPER